MLETNLVGKTITYWLTSGSGKDSKKHFGTIAGVFVRADGWPCIILNQPKNPGNIICLKDYSFDAKAR